MRQCGASRSRNMPDVGGGSLFDDILKAKKADPPLTAAENSLSRALFVLQTTLTTGWAVGAYAAVGTYGALVTAENMRWVPRWRGMRWMAPLGAFLTLQFVGARLGMIRSIDILSSNAALQRRADKAGDGEHIPLAAWSRDDSNRSKAATEGTPADIQSRGSMPSPAQEAWRAAANSQPSGR